MYRGYYTKQDVSAEFARLNNATHIKGYEECSLVEKAWRRFCSTFRSSSLPPTGEELNKREDEIARKVVARVSRGRHLR